MITIVLDPACEYFDYSPMLDVRDLIHLDDVMEDEELRLGPNGGLIFCLEYLIRFVSVSTTAAVTRPQRSDTSAYLTLAK